MGNTGKRVPFFLSYSLCRVFVQQGVSDRLEIDREEDLTIWFGNPCPGFKKTLRIRYETLKGVTRGRRSEVWLQEAEV